jgi:hypothetical protein
MWWRAALVVLAIAAAFLPAPRPLVERVYSVGVFPPLQIVITTLSNSFPFALFDVLITVAVIWWLGQLFRDVSAGRRTGWVRAAARIGIRTATIAAAAYLAFLVAWGLNYRRVRLADQLQFDTTRVSRDAAVSLAGQTVDHVNGLYDSAHRIGWLPSDAVDPALAQAFFQAQRELGYDARTVPGRPKRTMLDLYFRRAGVAGMTDPYFLETFVASDLLPFERPFVVAHEWSHLAGIADEGDANFAGWLTCLRGSAPHQYSGWLFLYTEVVSALDGPHAQAASARLANGPREDLRAIRDRLLQHVSPRVSAAGWRVYDRYLKANQVEQGAASYAEVVRLVLGTDFSGEWVPKHR